jgi:myosin heavy subunit
MAKKNLSEDEIKYIVTAETAKAQKEIHELSKANKELETSNRQRLNRMIELEAQGKKNTKEYQKLNKVYNEERKKINDNNKTIAERTRQLDVNAMSMVQLRKQAKDLRRELDNVAQALEPERYAELEAELAKVNGRMTELKAKVGEVKQEAQGFSFKDWFLGTAVSRVLVDSLQQAATWFRNVAAEGIEAAQAADGVTRAFRQLDDGHILDNLRKATKGTVTDLDLMKAAVQANDFYIPLQDPGTYLQFDQLKAQQPGQ